MATGKVPNEKPNAGNPHVRFDEGEAASAMTPRRGSLLCKAKTRTCRRALAALGALVAVLPALAETWTYNGANGGDPSANQAANYAAANVWKDAIGASKTFDTATTVARTYIVPAGKLLISHKDDTVATAGEWRFTANDDTFILRGSSTAIAHLRSSARRLYLPLLVMEDNSRVSLGLQDGTSTRWCQTLLGTVRVDASTSYPAVIQAWNYYSCDQTNATTVVGSGALYYVSRNTGGANTSTDGHLWLTECDASGFNGPVKIGMIDGGTGRPRMLVYVNSEDNIGGNPGSPQEKGLELAGVALHVQGDVTLPANRWLYIATNTPSTQVNPQGSVINVASGKTFAVPNSVGFQNGDYFLLKQGAGTLSLPGWASNGTVSISAGTLNITGVKVASGSVMPAAIGSLEKTGGTVKLTLSGDGSQLADGRYVLLTASGRLPDSFGTLVEVDNNGAFTLPSGKKAMCSVVNGTNLVLTVKDNVETWTYNGANGGDPVANQAANYAAANVWKDANGENKTFDSAATVARDYIVPAGKLLISHRDDTVATAGEWRFTANDDTFILRGSSTAIAHLRSSARRLYLPLLVMEDNSRVSLGLQDGSSTRWCQTLLGTVRVDASTSYPAVIQAWNYYACVQTNAAALVGSGALYYVSRNTGGGDNNTDGSLVLTECDAGGFTGPVKIGMLDGGTGRPRMHVTVNNADNIGGNPDVFLEKGLELAGIHLQVMGNVTLPENRGLYIATNTPSSSVSPQGPLVEVASGKTFAVQNVVGFQEDATAGCYTLSKSGAGTMKIPGWAANGAVSVTAGTLEITGARVNEGVVTPASIGSLAVSGGAVKIVVSGDGSELNLGDVRTLVDCGGTISDGAADYIQFVNDGAFTFAPGTKASLSVEDGTLKMTVVEYVPEWTLNTNNGVYTSANVWTDEADVRRTWTAATASTKIEYFVPARWTLNTPTGDVSTDLYALSTNPGSTLTVRSGGTFQSNVIYAHVPNIVLNDSAGIVLYIARNAASNYRSARSITGNLQINASEDNPAFFRVQAYYSDLVRTNAMTMAGSGGFKYTRQNGGADGIVWATGDNSGFTGPVAVRDMDTKNNMRMFLHVTSSENIGGNPETYKEKGLQLHSAQLCVHGNVALAPNRGFYVSSNSVVNVDSGMSFSSSNAVRFTDGTSLTKIGAGAMNVVGWTNGTIAVNAGTLNISGATFTGGAATKKVDIGAISYDNAANITLTVTGDGEPLPFANATNVLVEAESALSAGFAEKVRIVNDNAFTVSSRLKTGLIVIDGTKLALETKKRKGTVLIVR